MNHLNSIYQRLQSNYSDCDITYAPGLLTVKCKNGEIRADGFRTCFLEDGKTVQELLEKNDDNLYEEMERFILYLQEGGANLDTESLPTESEESAEDAVSDTVKSPAGFSSNTAEPVKPPRKWPALLSGIVIILYSLLGLFMTLFYMGDAPSVGIALGIVMHVSILLSGIALLVCRAPKLPEHSRPVICIQERLFVSVLAFIVWPLALFLLLIAFGYCVQPPLDVPFGLIMFLIGLGLLICGIWMLLAGKNRRLYVFENGSLTYMTSWGRKRELLPGQRFSIRFGANDSIQFLNADKKKIFAIERNMRGVDKLADWVESREIPLEITKLKEQQIQQEEGIEPVIQWREEYTTRLHSHLKEIRLGKWLVLALFWAGSIIPLFFFIAGALKFSQTIYLMAASPLPLIVYYLAFAPVLTLNGKQKGATAEWQSHHIRISLPLVLLPALWLMSVFHYGLEQVLIMEEKW